MSERLRIEVRGAVQGVGFRPFVYRLARQLALGGFVGNDGRGVTIEVEGDEGRLRRFLAQLSSDAPAPARIDGIRSSSIRPNGDREFRIGESDSGATPTVEMLPDIATCAACLAELEDPGDRRFGYPFTNCTHCGPRFTIIEGLPYDRPNTTMRRFAMCEICRTEYEEPGDRRFHAQPIACPNCGPRLILLGPDGRELAGADDAIDGAVAALREGAVVAVKGLGGFHLMVDAADGPALARLRGGKPRREKPFALMVESLDAGGLLCRIDDPGRAALSSPEAPIVLLPRLADSPVDALVAPGNPNLGLMLPNTPLHHLLLHRFGRPVVATSGNLSEEPICTDEREALHRLHGLADRFLVHDRPIARHADDSVAWVVGGQTRLLRRARGFSPRPILVSAELPAILAVGAHLKNAVAISVGRRVYVSQHVGDMETPQAMAAFERVVRDFVELYEIEPVAVAHDLHPDYMTTRWAQVAGEREHWPVFGVQHHHAHLASCLAENDRDESVLGVVWDGTGYGDDGTIWGGEFLDGDAASYRRVARLRPFRLPGGDAAIREPRRSALALLHEIDGSDRSPTELGFSAAERRLLDRMLTTGLNSPWTSSAGRLFDGVAALVGLHPQVSFEGQAAMALEHLAANDVRDAYPIELTPPSDESSVCFELDWRSMIEAIREDLRRAIDPPTIAARFHNGLTRAIVEVAGRVGRSTVALSGGCFQNRRLVEEVVDRLSDAGFEVLLHRQLPPNDGGICLGQLAVVSARLAEPRKRKGGI